MNIVIWGTGNFFLKRKKYFNNQKIVAFFDNDINKQGKRIEGVKIEAPCTIGQYDFDYVVIMTMAASEVRSQLSKLCPSKLDKCIGFDEFFSMINKADIEFPYKILKPENIKKKVLFLANFMDFDGGSIACMNAAIALNRSGYLCSIMAVFCNLKLQKSIQKNGVQLIINTELFNEQWVNDNWQGEYDLIIANTLNMLPCINRIHDLSKVMAWIHEPESLYKYVFINQEALNKLEKIKVICVSKKAEVIFLKNFSCDVDILFYPIPDVYQERTKKRQLKSKICFTIVGPLSTTKGQDIVIRAFEELNMEDRAKVQIIFAGSNQNSFGEGLMSKCADYSQIEFIGELNREQMQELYENSDCIICASRTEMLPMAVSEGMMNQKICIVSDAAGIVDIMKDGINGLIFSNENVDELSQKMQDVIERKIDAETIKKNARDTYMKYFSEEVFVKKFEKIAFQL